MADNGDDKKQEDEIVYPSPKNLTFVPQQTTNIPLTVGVELEGTGMVGPIGGSLQGGAYLDPNGNFTLTYGGSIGLGMGLGATASMSEGAYLTSNPNDLTGVSLGGTAFGVPGTGVVSSLNYTTPGATISHPAQNVGIGGGAMPIQVNYNEKVNTGINVNQMWQDVCTFAEQKGNMLDQVVGFFKAKGREILNAIKP